MTDRKKLREAAMKAMDPWPEPSKSEREGGWTISTDYLDEVAKQALADTGYDATWEYTERVLLIAEARIRSALAPSPAIGRDDEERVRGEDWENAAHDLLWETGRRDEFEALREKADENARERSQP